MRKRERQRQRRGERERERQNVQIELLSGCISTKSFLEQFGTIERPNYANPNT